MPGDVPIRPISTLKEYEACTDLQEEVWGAGFSEKVSAAVLMIANRIGGLAAGAFDGDGVLQGFVFGLTGMADGELVHWSDMLAVRTGERDRGIGTRVKLYQRQVMMERGVKEMRWTFDPLQARNAHVNFAKLGIVCREYVENIYGQTDSPLHRGIGTDRLVASWRLDSPRVVARLGGSTGEPWDESVTPPGILPVLEDGPRPSPGRPVLGLRHSRLLLPVPSRIGPIMDEDMPLAVRWREATRSAFAHYLSRGYEAREFSRGEVSSTYLLVDPNVERSRGEGP